MLKASAPKGSLSPDRGTISRMSALRVSFQGAVSDGMTPQGCLGKGEVCHLPARWEQTGERDLGALLGLYGPEGVTPPLAPSLPKEYPWAFPGLAVSVPCTWFGPSTSASLAGPGEVTSLGHCLQNTNSLGALVWRRGSESHGEEA